MKIKYKYVGSQGKYNYSDILLGREVIGCLIEILPNMFDSESDIKTIYQRCIHESQLEAIKQIKTYAYESEDDDYYMIQVANLTDFLQLYQLTK